MVDFTLSRTSEDHENEQYALAYNIDDVESLEQDSLLRVAVMAWRQLATQPGKAPAAESFRALLEMTPALAKVTHAVRYMVSGIEFRIDDAGREALRGIGIDGDLDLTAPELNKRAFASFLFIASNTTEPTYQRVCEICNGVQREYARLALPVDDGDGTLTYFMIRPLNAAETPLEQVRNLSELSDTDA